MYSTAQAMSCSTTEAKSTLHALQFAYANDVGRTVYNTYYRSLRGLTANGPFFRYGLNWRTLEERRLPTKQRGNKPEGATTVERNDVALRGIGGNTIRAWPGLPRSTKETFILVGGEELLTDLS